MGTDPSTSAAPISTGEYHRPRCIHVRHEENALDQADQWFVLCWESIYTRKRSGWTAFAGQMGKDFASLDLLQQLEIPTHEQSPAIIRSEPIYPIAVPNTLDHNSTVFLVAPPSRAFHENVDSTG